MRIPTLLAIGISLIFAGAAPLTAQQQWQVTKTFHIGGEGGWDYVTVDPPNHRIFVTRSTHTQAIDEETGKVLADIPGQLRSHGVALVPKLGRGFITDGGGNGAILVFDLKTYQMLGKITTMPDSDGIIYDPSTNLVLAVSGDGGALMTFSPDIDPKSGKVDAPIKLGGSARVPGGGRERESLHQSRGQGRGRRRGPPYAEGRLAVAHSAGRAPREHGDRCEGAPLVHRLPESAEDDRGKHGGRESGGGAADWRRRRCDASLRP